MHWLQLHSRSFKGQQGQPWEPLWQVIRRGCHSLVATLGRVMTQDNPAVPSDPGCHNHPWSNSLHEYYCRVTQASDTGDIDHIQRAGLQTSTAQHKYTLLPSLLPIPCCNPQSTSLDQSWELPGSLLGTRPPLLMVGSCTAQIPWHHIYPTAGLLPEETASHKLPNGHNWDFSSRSLK